MQVGRMLADLCVSDPVTRMYSARHGDLAED